MGRDIVYGLLWKNIKDMEATGTLKNSVKENAPHFIMDLLTEGTGLLNSLNMARIKRVNKIINEKPLILAVETTNTCNARCIFCAYPTMQRKRQVMPLDLFEKVVCEYSKIGGGALSLTPVVGDPLLDPYLIDRYKILEKFENIDQISFTTNGIAFDNFSDDQIKYILKNSFFVQFSIGGLDRETYKKLFQVDKLDETLSSVKRLIELKKDIGKEHHIAIAFRTDNPRFEKDYAKEIKAFQDEGVLISHIFTYNNYAGKVQTDKVKIKENRTASKRLKCAMPLIFAHVYADGKVTNCGCVDANGDGLVIGDANIDTINEAWKGKKREDILNSFVLKKVPLLCTKCNAYRPESYLGSNVFKNVKPHSRLPVEFYLNFFGG